jgi:hypothetical protein
MFLRPAAALSFALLFAAGCSEEEPTGADASTPMDAEEEAEAGFPDARRADLGVRDSGRPDRGVEADAGGDFNDDFDTAQPMNLGGNNAIDGVIDPAGDVDFYRLDLSNGSGFLVFDTEGNEDGDDAKVDTVLQIYNEARELVAQNDDHLLGTTGTLDSEIVYHVKQGVYYVKVQDYSTFGMNQTPRGNPDLTYSVSVFQPGGSIVTVDPEAGDTFATAPEMNQQGFGYVMGTFRDIADVDHYKVIVTDTGAQTFVIDMMPLGPTGFGATPTGVLTFYNADGTIVEARGDVTRDEFEPLQPSLVGGRTYILEITQSATVAGPNDFYVLKGLSYGDNDPSMDVEPENNTMMGAEPLVMLPATADAPRRAFFLSHLGDDDEDYFSVETSGAEELSVACGSLTAGSGIQDLSVQVLTSTGGVVGAAQELPPDNLFLPTVTSTGTLFIRFFKTAQDPENVGDFYRCGVRANIE